MMDRARHGAPEAARGAGVAARLALLAGLCLVPVCVPTGDDGALEARPRSPAERVVAELRLAGSPLPDALPRPDFVLTDTSGAPFDFRRETAGRLTLLFFGYTSCPDICPVHLANVAAALRKLRPEVARAVRVVFVGVDPERDTPARMREWLERFDPRFVGLTGSAEALAAAQRAAGVPAAFVDREWEDGYSVSHAGWITVYTADDLAHLRYPFGTRQKQWAHDLAVLAGRGWPRS